MYWLLPQGRNYFLKPNDVSNTAQNHSADKCSLRCSTLTHQTAVTPSCVLGFSFFRRPTYPCDRPRNPNSPLLCSLSVPLIGSDTHKVMLPLVWDRVCALSHCLSQLCVHCFPKEMLKHHPQCFASLPGKTFLMYHPRMK